jgi:FixJ family two-component response regulator
MIPLPIHIAILDDDPFFRRALARVLKLEGMVVDSYATSGQFFDALALERPDCLLLDFEMPLMSGVDVLKRLDRLSIRVPTIIVTARDDAGTREACRNAGAIEYLHKPVIVDRLMQVIEGIRKPQPVALRASVSGVAG